MESYWMVRVSVKNMQRFRKFIEERLEKEGFYEESLEEDYPEDLDDMINWTIARIKDYEENYVAKEDCPKFIAENLDPGDLV